MSSSSNTAKKDSKKTPSVNDDDLRTVTKGKMPKSSDPIDLDVSVDDYMDIDDDDDSDDEDDGEGSSGPTVETLSEFCRDAARSFFNEHGLISHQISSYNDFIENGIQRIFDSIGEIVVEPGYDPSKKGEGGWRYASVKFGKIKIEKPQFWTGEKPQDDLRKEYLDLTPRHARLQNMTYSARMKVEINLQVTDRLAHITCDSFIFLHHQSLVFDDFKRTRTRTIAFLFHFLMIFSQCSFSGIVRKIPFQAYIQDFQNITNV